MDAEARAQRERLSKAARQRRWRAKRAARAKREGDSVTAHLTNAETAVLDAIAAELYRAHPHDPAAGVLSDMHPGRPEAIRTLIREYRARNPHVKRPAPRDACADFWRVENSWRQVRDPGTTVLAPSAPWRTRK